MLPGMIMPTRRLNYDRIANYASGSIQAIDSSIGDLYACHALRWRELNLHDEITKPALARLEFRQGAAEADPFDIALAAAIPFTKGCLAALEKDERGKAVIEDGMPKIVPLTKSSPTPASPMPRSHEEAAALFNTPDNPNFTFLDELSQQRIARLHRQYQENPSPVAEHALRHAESLAGLGTKLHHLYCREYGLESAMPLPASAREVF